MRPIIYHVASSLDGFIARKDGTTDGFLQEGEHIPDYLESLKEYDTVIMGRNTYTDGYSFGLKPGQPAYPHMRHYIFSTSLDLPEKHEKVQIVAENGLEVLRHLRQEEGAPIYLCGGGNFAGFLLGNDLIDTLLIKQNPVCFGAGIPLFGPYTGPLTLDLLDLKRYNSGVLLLKYRIKRKRTA